MLYSINDHQDCLAEILEKMPPRRGWDAGLFGKL